MIRRSIFAGIVAGFLLTLASLYPALAMVAPAILPGWERPLANELLHGLLLMGSAIITLPVLVGLGPLAVRWTQASGWVEGAKHAGLAAIFAGYTWALAIITPVNALAAYGKVVDYLPAPGQEAMPPTPALYTMLRTLESGALLVEVVTTLFIGLIAVQGAYLAQRRRQQAPAERPSLFGLVEQGIHPRRWFARQDTSLRNGLIVGVVVSLLLLPTMYGEFYGGLAQDVPELAALMRRSATGTAMRPLRHTLPLLAPLVSLSLLGFGAVIILWSRNPTSRFRARINAVVFATLIITTAATALATRIYLFFLGLMPFLWYANAEIEGIEILGMAPPMALIESRAYFVGGAFAFTWLIMGVAVAAGILLGLVEGSIYALIIPIFQKRPVDEAAAIHGQIKREPEEVLPVIYRFFGRAEAPYEVLAHLAARTYRRQPDLSRLVAAYHTMGTSNDPAVHVETGRAIGEILAAHPEWRWSEEFAIVYNSLGNVLQARTLDQILAIPKPPEHHTSSLPPLIVQSVKAIGRIVQELHKVERVDDLSTRLIFLENTLESINQAQRVVAGQGVQEMVQPEERALTQILEQWQTLVLEAIRQLKGRADVHCDLKTAQTAHATRLPLVFEVANNGLNVAQQVRVRLAPGEDYHLDGDREAWIEILPPGEARQVTLNVLPANGTRRLRVAWDVLYDDAVDAERHLNFADVVRFTDPDKPFRRIFPIPYVTGTPLKSDDVFVGREDVFAFIRENLVGAHQNNVIILHGQRRTGKTSVLYRLRQVMAETHYGVLIDMQGKPARSEADFLYSIADDIAFALEDHDIFLELPERADFEETPEFFFRSRFLRGLRPHLGERNLLLMFDEFEELQRRVEAGRLKPEIFQFLRNLMQHDEKVDFVFSGTHRLESLGAEYWSVLFNIAAYKPITFLSPEEVRRLIFEPVAGENVEYDPLAVERIAEVTAGHPYFTQLVLHEMIVYYNESQRTYLTVTDVNQVLERIVERGEAHFKYIWSESSEEERLLLRALAELLVSAGSAHVDQLRDLLESRGHTSEDNWASALRSLAGRDILTRRAARSPFYRFKVDLIRLWIEETRPGL